MVGTSKIFAALARTRTLFTSVWRSMLVTPKVICGWWSMKMTVQFSGVSRLRIACDNFVAPEGRCHPLGRCTAKRGGGPRDLVESSVSPQIVAGIDYEPRAHHRRRPALSR